MLFKLCFNNETCTKQLCDLLMNHITLNLDAYKISPYLSFDIRSEMSVFTNLNAKYDSCWEIKLRYVIKLFLRTCPMLNYPMIITSITLPCLKIIQNTIKQKPKVLCEPSMFFNNTLLNVEKWLEADPKHSFEEWQRKISQKKNQYLNVFLKTDVHCFYLQV